jgi:hypothetical protein
MPPAAVICRRSASLAARQPSALHAAAAHGELAPPRSTARSASVAAASPRVSPRSRCDSAAQPACCISLSAPPCARSAATTAGTAPAACARAQFSSLSPAMAHSAPHAVLCRRASAGKATIAAVTASTPPAAPALALCTALSAASEPSALQAAHCSGACAGCARIAAATAVAAAVSDTSCRSPRSAQQRVSSAAPLPRLCSTASASAATWSSMLCGVAAISSA